MTRVGNLVTFNCPNPRCNELLRLIQATVAESVKARAAASATAELATLEVQQPASFSTTEPDAPRRPHLYAVPRIAPTTTGF